MATRRAKAVLNIKSYLKVNEVYELALIVVDKMTLNSALFPNPKPPLSLITQKAETLRELIVQVNSKNSIKIGLRNEASKELFNLLRWELDYVNLIANANRAIIVDSGFKCSKDPEPIPAPPQVIIRRVEVTKQNYTVRLVIESLKMRYVSYLIQFSTERPEENKWSNYIVRFNMYKLFIPNMVHGQEVWFRICASISGKQGLWSNPIPFIYYL